MKTQLLVDEPPTNPPIEELPIFSLEQKMSIGGQVITSNIIGLDSPILKDGTISALYLSNEEFLAKPSTLLEIVKFLTDNFNGKNASFVTYYPHILEAFVKLLGEENCRTLIAEGKLNTFIFRIWYIPNNKITIVYNKKTIRIFALGNWFEKRTDEYILKELGIVDSKDLQNIDDSSVLESIKNGAVGYKKLAERINKASHPILSELNGDFSSPTALTKRFLYTDYRRFNPEDVPWDVYSIAYNCIHAPWIEMFQQGTFASLWDYDINAAYPSEIAKLYWIDNYSGTWLDVSNLNNDRETRATRKSTYGFYIAAINMKEYTPSPIQLRYKDRLLAPFGEWIGYITLQEIEFIEEYNLGTVKILSGWEFKMSSPIHPFARTVQQIAKLRAEAIRQQNNPNNPNAYLTNYILKKASARLVGKFLQRTEKLDGNWELAPTFNPIYAAIVMVNIKLRIARYIRGFGDLAKKTYALNGKNLTRKEAIESNIVSITVDGFTAKSELGVMGKADRIGELKWDKHENITVAAPLISNLPHHHLPLINQLNQQPQQRTYRFPMERPRLTICEALAIDNFSHAVSILTDETLTLNVGRDSKRHWITRPLSGQHLLEDIFISEQRDADSMLIEEQMHETIVANRKRNEEALFASIKEENILAVQEDY